MNDFRESFSKAVSVVDTHTVHKFMSAVEQLRGCRPTVCRTFVCCLSFPLPLR